MRRCLAVLSLLIAGAAPAADRVENPRFAGQATLSAPTPASPDGRYALHGELVQAPAAPAASPDGKLTLTAALAPKSELASNCVVERVFNDGFE